MSFGMAPVFTILNQVIISAAPPERAGAASAISETASEFSGASGIAVFGRIGTVIYRNGMAGAMPAGVPPDARLPPWPRSAGRSPRRRRCQTLSAMRCREQPEPHSSPHC